ncbi:hypothetical protein Dimus_015798, partial [Dionaea muscipula]
FTGERERGPSRRAGQPHVKGAARRGLAAFIGGGQSHATMASRAYTARQRHGGVFE